MSFAVRALLGIGTLKFFSIWDESIDWDASNLLSPAELEAAYAVEQALHPEIPLTEKEKETIRFRTRLLEVYVLNPLKYESKLVFKPGVASSPIHCRAADDLDLVECSTAKLVLDDHGEQVQTSNPKKEQVHLFRRCIRAIDNYYVDNEKGMKEKFEVVLIRSSDGREQADEATMKKVPMALASEIGSYLLRSQVMTDELKNA
jgi:hypothetical protein